MKVNSLYAPPSGKTLTVYTGFHPPSGKMKTSSAVVNTFFRWQLDVSDLTVYGGKWRGLDTKVHKKNRPFLFHHAVRP